MSDTLANVLGDDEQPEQPPPVAVTIAGSDSGGGAGQQADLKTFAAHGVHGASVITLVTAQNTVDVTGIDILEPSSIRAQYDAVVGDLQPAAAKSGALGDARTIRTVADCLETSPIERFVADPVMVSKHGDVLLPEEAQSTMAERLLPLADLATPNRHEAEALTGERVRQPDGMKEAAKRIYDLGVPNVLVKGGHLEDVVRDYLYDGTGFVEYGADRVETDRLHGSGCVFSSAITAQLAGGNKLEDAIGEARDFITRAIEAAPPLGQGIAPVNPMHVLQNAND